MASADLVARWRFLATAVDARDWPRAEHLADELARDLEHLPRSHPGGWPYDRDGLYTLGWQWHQDAPRSTRRAIARLNETLRSFAKKRKSRS